MYFAVRADSRERISTERKLLAEITEMEELWKGISSIVIEENAPDIKDSSRDTTLENPDIASPPKLIVKEPTRKRKRQAKTMADDSDASEDDLSTTLAILKKSRTKSKSKPVELDDNDLS